MKRKKELGARGHILLDDVDLNVLKIIHKSDKDLSIGEIQDKINMSHVSFKEHVRRLEKLKFIFRKRVPKMFKFNLIITDEGEELLKIFEKSKINA